MKAEKYADFFEEAEKSMSKDSIRCAEREAKLVSYCLSLGLGVEINALQVNQKGKSIKNLLRIPCSIPD
jgi:hypothetical protein